MKTELKVIGIDLAKNVFQLHGTDASGKPCLKRRFDRNKLITFMSNTSPCLVGIEACNGAHHWSRLLAGCGHTVKIMAPQLVKPYVMSQKNDANDARAIAEAVTCPDMRFVPQKSCAQQDVLLLHRARQLAVKNRTAQANQIRGMLAEYGVLLPLGIYRLRQLPALLSSHSGQLTPTAIRVFEQLHEQFKLFDKQVDSYEQSIRQHAKTDVRCEALQTIDGIGPVTASALVASVGNGHDFKNGRELAAWLGLVPRQHTSGHRIRLGSITKRGDRYLRCLLVHGARTVLRHAEGKTDAKSKWVTKLKSRMPANKVAVALANKHARIIWAMLQTGEIYQSGMACGRVDCPPACW